jgi:hypothetical protein
MSGATPFQYLGEDDVLVAQMIGFLGDLPTEWQPKWECMRSESRHVKEYSQGELINGSVYSGAERLTTDNTIRDC